jgi:hypothetical protein
LRWIFGIRAALLSHLRIRTEVVAHALAEGDRLLKSSCKHRGVIRFELDLASRRDRQADPWSE